LKSEKSSDHAARRMTFCGYKKRNLLKPMMVVAPSGLIIAAEGLYYTDFGNNDSKILQDILHKSNSLMNLLIPGDATLVDRQFQGAKAYVEGKGLKFFMPSILDKKQKQFTTEQANASRKVTVLRYIVELANGRIKNKYRFFDDVIRSPYLPMLNKMFLFGCALLNKYSNVNIKDDDFHEKVAEIIEQRMDKPNLLKQKVEQLKWDTRQVIWEPANEDCALGFPALTLEDLKEITLGVYQTKMGNNYNEEHISPDNSYVFCTHKEEPGIIKVQMRSRYSSRTRRVLWIEYSEYVNGSAAVKEWYCKCPIGARTVGVCSHIAAVRV